jgi:uncharacterized glyoxalase superfamily protein PhnB
VWDIGRTRAGRWTIDLMRASGSNFFKTGCLMLSDHWHSTGEEAAMTTSAPYLYPALHYADANAAIDWLERAFGFHRMMVVPGDGDTVSHAELAFGGGVLMLGTRHDGASSPQSAPYVYVADVDAHAARAEAAGARITRPPEDKPYGGRGYSVCDLEGNEWSFGGYRPTAPDAGERPETQT